MKLFLLENGFDITAGEEDKYKMIISASTGQIRFEDIRTWIEERLIKKHEA